VVSEHEPIPRRLELRTAAAAARILFTEVGVRLATVVLADVAVAQARGEPFRHLDPPEDDRERLCRRQAGPAVLMQRALRRWLGSERALEITREIVIAGAVVFLQHTIGPLEREVIMEKTPEERDEMVQALGGRFFNAEVRWDEISEKAVRFTVNHCRFPALCKEGDAPEVAPLLCLGDAVYFGEVLGTVDLVRSQTLADGGDCCPFELTWRTDVDPEDSGAS
jgi:predicted ArsR family transcriptional regulator